MTELYPFQQDENYIKLVKEYLEAMKHQEKQRKYDTDAQTQKDTSQQAYRDILSKVDEFHTGKVKFYEDKKETIKKSYKNKPTTYTNPQEEALKREDFNLKLSVSDDAELEDMVRDNDVEMNEYQLNRITQEFNTRGIQSVSLTERKMKAHTGKEYEGDVNYQNVDGQSNSLVLVRARGADTMLHVPSNEKGAFHINDLTKNKRAGQTKKDIEDLEEAIKVMERNVVSQNELERKLSKPIMEDLTKQIDEDIAAGKKFNEYDNADLRAVKGSDEYDLEDEYKYLKERYQEKDNPLYQIGNPDYEIKDHLEFLRSKHQTHLKDNAELVEQIESNLKEEQAELETDEEEQTEGKPQVRTEEANQSELSKVLAKE